jgi:membrane-bound inhibitor of C-type lysozyme
MDMRSRALGLVLLGVAAVIAIGIVEVRRSTDLLTRDMSTPHSSMSYRCSEGKTIEVQFVEDDQFVRDPAEQPQGTAILELSDGRTLELKETPSADGQRFANDDATFIFWVNGNGALILENNEERSYVGCVALASQGELPYKYSNTNAGFSLHLPAGFTPDDSYIYRLNTGEAISGVKFTIPASAASSTNLSIDSYVSIERIPGIQTCTTSLFLSNDAMMRIINDSGTTYAVAQVTGAAAGNRYEEMVYAIPGSNPCIAVRYFIHSTSVENYPPGTVTGYDRDALLAQFDAIRRTLLLTQ